MDPRIVDKIHQMVEDGVQDVCEMNRHIQIYVKNTLFACKPFPPKSNRHYFPSRSTIKNHMYIAISRQRLAKVDQENPGFSLIQNIAYFTQKISLGRKK